MARSGSRRTVVWTCGVVWTLLTGAAGCGIDLAYLLPQAAGQLDIVANSRPVWQVLAEDELTEVERQKLDLIEDARVFAGSTMGLNTVDNYVTYYDSDGDPIAFNISAATKDALSPFIWTFPLVGSVPYLGYFSEPDADVKFAQLEALGYDVFKYEIDAYSGLGFIPNPVFSPMLERSDLNLVDTVIHELLHATVWRQNDATFNESLATFYGRQGTIDYLADRYPDRPDLQESALQLYEDSDRFAAFIGEFTEELTAYYASDLASEAKIAGREELYQAARDRFEADVLPLLHYPGNYEWVVEMPTNNAWLLGVRRYNYELDGFEAVYNAAGGNWTTALGVYANAAASSDPYAYMAAWVGE